MDSEFAPLRTVVVSQSEFRATDNIELLGHKMPVEPNALGILDAVWGKSLGEAAAMATNGLPIDSETYVTDPQFERVGKQLAPRGITVEYIDFSVSRLFGGAFRCTIQPLLRAE